MSGITTMLRGLAAALLSAVCVSGASAGSLSGTSSGPDDTLDINLFFTNFGPGEITSLSINGSTAIPSGPLVWDFIGNPSGPAGGTAVGAGEDTSVMTWSFTGWDAGEAFDLTSIDPDTPGDPSFGATIADLIGVTVTAQFADGSTFTGVYIDDPARDAGIVLQVAPVPLPGAVVLFASAIAGLGLYGARRPG